MFSLALEAGVARAALGGVAVGRRAGAPGAAALTGGAGGGIGQAVSVGYPVPTLYLPGAGLCRERVYISKLEI